MNRPVLLLAPLLLLMVALAGCGGLAVAGQSSGPTPTPRLTVTPWPTVAPGDADAPPRGRGVEMGRPYPFSLYVHCGVRDAYFDGRWWMADPPLGNGNPPPGWTPDDTTGTMTLVQEDLAVFTANSGRTVEFIPWPPGLERGLCV